jgi:anti-anti-sigma regulatory factor
MPRAAKWRPVPGSRDCHRSRILGRSTARNHPAIVLYIADIIYIDSAGIGERVSDHAAVAHAGGELKLLNPAKGFRRRS